jgi:hemin uptake protein HemP
LTPNLIRKVGGNVSEKEADRDEETPTDPRKVVRAEELFGEEREIWIDLDGIRYRLRITRRGKLILQK